MDSLVANASRILAAAQGCAQANHAPGDWTVLLGPAGEIEMIADREGPLEALRVERGAAMAFRVGERGGLIAVEGRGFGRGCRLESETPASVARRLLARTPAYTLARAALPPAAI